MDTPYGREGSKGSKGSKGSEGSEGKVSPAAMSFIIPLRGMENLYNRACGAMEMHKPLPKAAYILLFEPARKAKPFPGRTGAAQRTADNGQPSPLVHQLTIPLVH